MGSDRRSLRLLLFVAIPGVVLLGVGTLVTLQSEQERHESERSQDRRQLLADAAERVRDEGRADLRRVEFPSESPEVSAGVAGPTEPLGLGFDLRDDLIWPRRAPLVRREDVRALLTGVDRGHFDVVVDALARDPLAPATADVLESAARSNAPPLSLFARFHRWVIRTGSEDGAADLRRREAWDLLRNVQPGQVSAHRQTLRRELASELRLQGDRVGARTLWLLSVTELTAIGLGEPSVALAWMDDLAERLDPEVVPTDEVAARKVAIESTYRRLGWLPERWVPAGGSASVGGRECWAVRWEGPGSAALGTFVVLPPEEPMLSEFVRSAGFTVRRRDASGAEVPPAISLAPLFPEHDLVAPPAARPDAVPRRTLLTAAFLLSGLGVAVLGVLASQRSVAARERDLQERAELLASLSHQLKTPVANVRLFAETLCTTALSPPERSRMERILHSEALRLQDVLQRILAYQAAEERRETPLERVDLVALLATRSAHWTAAAQQRGLDLQVDLGTSSCSVRGDERGLSDALDNLVDNACAVLEPGGRVRVRLSVAAAAARLEVEDDGPGIEPADRPHVFERFYRGRTARSRAGGGSGLGLAIVAAVAQRHGGHVAIARTGPGGTTMELVLRREGNDDQDPAGRR